MREALRQQYLQAMGVQLWESRVSSAIVEVPEPVYTVTVEPEVTLTAEPVPLETALENKPVKRLELDWAGFNAAVESCQQCGLYENRIFAVPGNGDPDARLMLVGEAPGADEDRQGEPFVGHAGQLLNEMLRAMGYQRKQVYVTNLVKCRPPNNRDPEEDELLACEPFLQQQIESVQPSLIIALGRFAAQRLLNTQAKIGELRGSLHRCAGSDIPVLVTYHPAYLLRKPSEKRKSWQDLQQGMAFLQKFEST